MRCLPWGRLQQAEVARPSGNHARSVLPIHAHQCARDRRIAADGRIDSSGERHKITVGRAHDDSRMSSGGFVVADLLLDFGRVGMPVGPRLDQILGTQRRVGPQQVGLAGPEPTGLNEQPHGNTRANDARLTAADIRQGIDPGKTFVKLGDNVSHQTRLLATRKAANQIDCLFKGRHLRFSLRGTSLGLSTPRRSE